METKDLYVNSELSLAAYADFSSARTGAIAVAALVKAGMSQDQATEFLSNWTVVAQRRCKINMTPTHKRGDAVWSLRGVGLTVS